MTSINVVNPTNDFYDRIAAMCEEAVPGSRATPDYTEMNAGSLWWIIKLTRIETIWSDNTRNRDRYTWELVFVLGQGGAGQGKQRKEISNYIDAIRKYFAEQFQLTTSTQNVYAEVPGSVSLVSTGEGMGAIPELAKYRLATFNLTFNFDLLITRRL